MNKKSILILLGTLCTSHLVFEKAASAKGFRQHGAHVHGYVLYDIAQDDKDLLIEISSPGMDVAGFEHDVRNDQEAQVLKKVTGILQDSSTIIDINSEAQCVLVDSQVERVKDLLAPVSKKKVHNPFVDHTAHSNFAITYSYKCQSPQDLNSIKTAWFKYFKATKAITVNLLTAKRQTVISLNKDSTQINLDD